MKRTRPVLKARHTLTRELLRTHLYGHTWHDLLRHGRFSEINGISFRTEIGTFLKKHHLGVMSGGFFLVLKPLVYKGQNFSFLTTRFDLVEKPLNPIKSRPDHGISPLDVVWAFELPENWIHELVIPDAGRKPDNDP